MARIQNVAGWCLSVLMAIVFVAAGATKFRSPQWEMRFSAWGYPDWVRIAVGVLEVLCAILLLVPRARLPAALVLTTLMVGAAGTHLLNQEAPRVVVNLLLAALLVAVVALNRRGDRRGGEESAGRRR